MDLSNLKYHERSEKLVEILCSKTQNNDPRFFRIMVAYFAGVLASNMHVTVTGFGANKIPINVYAVNLSPSGTGKGMSTGFVERNILPVYKQVLLEDTMPTHAEMNIANIADRRALRKGTVAELDELPKLEKEYDSLGSFLFSFDSATTPAVKQLRHLILIGGSGSLNLQIDEIGANLLSQSEVLISFLELFDIGLIKEKLVKSSAENMRYERLEGSTPANMLLFGTPSKLFDGAQTEKQFFDFLQMGYARRSFFGFSPKSAKQLDITPEQAIAQMFDNSDDQYVDQLAIEFGKLADINNLHKTVEIEEDELKILIAYKLDCERKAQALPQHLEIQKMELEHRYFKALKLAGAYAFMDGLPSISEDHINSAIRLAEDSGEALTAICEPERPYMKLAKHIAEVREEQTWADLDTDCPYLTGGKAAKEDMLNMAIAWGYKNNIVIKKSFTDGILFISGETLEETNMDALRVAFTTNHDMTTGYQGAEISFEDLEEFATRSDIHWLNHWVENGHRREDNIIPGFNLIVLDVDGTYPITAAMEILEGYRGFIYTTKSHTDDTHRYRIVLPTNYTLYLNREDYKEFMANVFQSLPFQADEQGDHRSKKWLSNDGESTFFGNEDAQLFDVTPFIPKTKKNDDRKEHMEKYGSQDALENWFINNIGNGNRNHQLHKFARVLIDQGHDFPYIQNAVYELNDKIADKLSRDELNTTVLATVMKHMSS